MALPMSLSDFWRFEGHLR